MKLSRWILCVALDTAILTCLYLWRIQGMQGAENVVLALCWPIAVLGLIAGIYQVGNPNPERHTLAYRIYGHISTVVVFGSIAWSGMPVLASVLLVGWIFLSVARIDAAKKATP